jgi:signal transduction histidine kinase
MLSLPGIKGLIKPFEHKRASAERESVALADQVPHGPQDEPDHLVRLATYLAADVLAVLELAPDGKSVEITAAAQGGFKSSMSVPLLDEKGPLYRLIARARASGGRAKIFSSSEVFPRDAHWCDFVPMDSTISYFFMPLAGLPASGPPDKVSGLFVLVADLAGRTVDRSLELKACAAASLLRLSRSQRCTAGQMEVSAALEAFLRSRGYSLIIVDARGGVVRRAGDAFESMTGETIDALGQTLQALEGIQPDAEAQGVNFQVSEDLKGTLYPVWEPGLNSSYLLVLDAPERSADDNLRRELLKLLGRFTSSIAHEIKNPLTGISAGVQYLAKRLQPGATEADTVDFILAEIARLNRIVDDLYMVSRPPQMTIRPTAIDDVVAKSLFCLSEDIVKKRLHLEQRLEPGIPEFNADPERLQQVLINVLKNAIEATPENGSIEISTCRREGRVRVAVKDSGPGVPAADREKVFEPFYSTKKGGTGLGLCISQSIIDEHNGKMVLETPPGGGACFIMELPTESRGA